MTLREREEILEQAREDPELQAIHKEMCRRNFAYFCSTSLNIFEPRETRPEWVDKPYLLRDFQAFAAQSTIDHITEGRDLLIDKTREMGVTWLLLAIYLWYWLFFDKFTGLVSSITEKKIDSRGDPSCQLWKFDYLLESVRLNSPWLFPTGYTASNQECKAHMRRYNPATGSIVTGEVMGPNLGRSGRYKVIFLDEFAEAASPASTFGSSGFSSPCRIFVFTPKGMNFAGRLANPRQGQPRAMDRLTLHWKVDYTKNFYEVRDAEDRIVETGNGDASLIQPPLGGRVVYPWYENAMKRLGHDPVLIAQELDCNYNESIEGIMYPQVGRSRFGDFPYDPALTLYCSMDYGLDDMTALVWVQFDPRLRRFRVIDAYQNRGKTISWYVPFITGQNLGLGDADGGYNKSDLEVIERHRIFQGRYTDWFGDPAGKQRNQVTATSVISVLADHHIYVRTRPDANSHPIRRVATGFMLLYTDFNEGLTDDLVQALRDSRFLPSGIPVHGPESHYRTALEYFAVNQPHGLMGENGTRISEDYLRYAAGVGDNGLMPTDDPRKVVKAMDSLFKSQQRAERESAVARTRPSRFGSTGYTRWR